MEELELGPAYARIGEIVAELAAPSLDTILLYVEIEDGMTCASVVVDRGEKVQWIEPTSELTQCVYAIWQSLGPDKRWATMTYVLRDGKFNATFRFPDEVNVADCDDERTDAAIIAVFGDKPVEYPQPDDDSWLIGEARADGPA